MLFSLLKNFKVLVVFIWLCWMGLHMLVLNFWGFNNTISFWDSFIWNILLAMSCIVLGNIIRYYQPSRNSAWKLIIWCLLATLIWLGISYAISSRVLWQHATYLLSLNQSLPVRLAIGLLTIGCTLLIVWIWEYVAFNHEDANRQVQAIAIAKEAELNGLTQQLQPHFLFNSLNSITALIGNRPEDARNMIGQLSDFLRGTLKKDTSQKVPLKEELNQLELYLNIEKVRFGHRLKTTLLIDEGLSELLLPPLILQPLIENAIKFGLYDTIGQVEIILNATLENNVLKIQISNPFDPDTSVQNTGTGFGLKSVKRRLYLIYGRMDLLNTETDNNTFITTLFIPQTKV